jgi:hypothetical protein
MKTDAVAIPAGIFIVTIRVVAEPADEPMAVGSIAKVGMSGM